VARVAAQAGVHLQVDPCRPFLFTGRQDNPLQLPAGAADVDAGGDGGTEVAVRCVQPREQRRLDAGGAQGERFGDVRNTEPPGSGVERCPGHRNGTVPVGIRLHDGHDLRR